MSNEFCEYYPAYIYTGSRKQLFKSEVIVPEYRRANIPGSSVFLTLITYDRAKLFASPENIDKLRKR